VGTRSRCCRCRPCPSCCCCCCCCCWCWCWCWRWRCHCRRRSATRRTPSPGGPHPVLELGRPLALVAGHLRRPSVEDDEPARVSVSRSQARSGRSRPRVALAHVLGSGEGQEVVPLQPKSALVVRGRARAGAHARLRALYEFPFQHTAGAPCAQTKGGSQATHHQPPPFIFFFFFFFFGTVACHCHPLLTITHPPPHPIPRHTPCLSMPPPPGPSMPCGQG